MAASRSLVLGAPRGVACDFSWQSGAGGSSSRRIAVVSAPAATKNDSSSNLFHDHEVPKLEPFNRSISSRWMKEESLLEKAEHALEDKCSVLEGDESYDCWQALFEFEDLKNEYEAECDVAAENGRSMACQPLERLKNLIRQSTGVTSLMNNLSMLLKRKKIEGKQEQQQVLSAAQQDDQQQEQQQEQQQQQQQELAFFEPGSLPKSKEELEEEQKALMPDSGFTRLLRRRGTNSSWFPPLDF